MMKTAIGHENLGDKANSKRNIINIIDCSRNINVNEYDAPIENNIK